tara:strand:+ start:2450 stop:2656 length:207 start_codon:yes stop_codon:yes gene_type:complete
MNIQRNLIYKNQDIKRAAGIEPASSAWKAEVLPLNYARTNTKDLNQLAPILYKHLPIITLSSPTNKKD